jgi:hypothetical protein
MTVNVVCDIGGEQEPVSGTVLERPGSLLSPRPARVQLPDGWRYVELPVPDGSKWSKAVCPDCLTRLWALFGLEPEGCVRCGHSPGKHISPVCRVESCECSLSRVECLDPGWAGDVR